MKPNKKQLLKDLNVLPSKIKYKNKILCYDCNQADLNKLNLHSYNPKKSKSFLCLYLGNTPEHYVYFNRYKCLNISYLDIKDFWDMINKNEIKVI